MKYTRLAIVILFEVLLWFSFATESFEGDDEG